MNLQKFAPLYSLNLEYVTSELRGQEFLKSLFSLNQQSARLLRYSTNLWGLNAANVPFLYGILLLAN